MTKNNKGRAGWHQATPKTSDSRNPTPTATRTKALIVGAACWGVIPFRLADWLIRRLRLGAA